MGNITQKWVGILVPFTQGYSKRFTESELARLSKTPQQTASRHLNNLLKENLVSYEKQGKNKLFYLDLSRPTTNTIIQLIENIRSIEFQLKLPEISIITNELSKHSESTIIFGSYANNKFDKESDLDLVFVGNTQKQKIKQEKQKYNIQINEHYITYEELKEAFKNKNPLAIEILKSHIILGDISKITKIMMEATR